MGDANDRLEILLGLERWDEAEREARTALAQNPNWARGYTQLARALAGKGREREAIEAARSGVGKDPHDHWIHVVLGWVLSHFDQYEPAVRAAREALRLKPDYLEAHQVLAQALGNAGDDRAAGQAAREGLRYAPDDPSLLATLGWSEYLIGDVKVAAEAGIQGLRQDARCDNLHSLIGHALLRQTAGTLWPATRVRLHRRAGHHFAEACRLDPTREGRREVLRENAVSCRRYVLMFLFSVAVFAAAGLTLVPLELMGTIQTSRILTNPGSAFFLVVMLLAVAAVFVISLLRVPDAELFVLVAPLGWLELPVVPLSRWERWRGRLCGVVLVACLALTPVVAWVTAIQRL